MVANNMRPSLKELFNSSAKVIYLSRFKLKNANWSKSNNFSTYNYSFDSLNNSGYYNQAHLKML